MRGIREDISIYIYIYTRVRINRFAETFEVYTIT
jgi:hypothetical protein